MTERMVSSCAKRTTRDRRILATGQSTTLNDGNEEENPHAVLNPTQSGLSSTPTNPDVEKKRKEVDMEQEESK